MAQKNKRNDIFDFYDWRQMSVSVNKKVDQMLEGTWNTAIMDYTIDELEFCLMSGWNVNQNLSMAGDQTALHNLAIWPSPWHEEAHDKSRLLLQHKANVFARNGRGRMPLDIAIDGNWGRNHELIRLLQDTMCRDH